MAPRATFVLSLLAATAAANLTTSFYLPNGSYGTNRLRFHASVINASDDRVTVVAHVVDDPEYSALGDFVTETFTLASTLIDFSTSYLFNRHYSSLDNGVSAYSYRCETQATASAADCTVSMGSSLVIGQCRPGNYLTRSAQHHTEIWTFSETDTAGVETIVHTIPGSPTTPMPAWCSDATALSEVSIPSSALVRTFKGQKSAFGLYQFVITAGEEKIPSATTGGAVSTDSVAPTGTGGSSGGSGESASGTGSPGAAPMKTVAPALAGLGAAVAMFL